MPKVSELDMATGRMTQAQRKLEDAQWKARRNRGNVAAENDLRSAQKALDTAIYSRALARENLKKNAPVVKWED